MADLLTQQKLRLYVVAIMVGLWVVGIFVAVWDGNVMVKLMTPFMSMSLGWLFTERATG